MTSVKLLLTVVGNLTPEFYGLQKAISVKKIKLVHLKIRIFVSKTQHIWLVLSSEKAD